MSLFRPGEPSGVRGYERARLDTGKRKLNHAPLLLDNRRHLIGQCLPRTVDCDRRYRRSQGHRRFDWLGRDECVKTHYVVGPALDIGLPLGFGVEVDALYRREGFQSTYGNAFYSASSEGRANSWEFPLLLKYRLPVPLVKPFAEVGYAPRVIDGSITNTFYLPPLITSSSEHWPDSQGLVIGGGVQLAIGRLRLSPGVRYTHWNNTPITGVYSNGPSFESTQNQVDILVGIEWKIR